MDIILFGEHGATFRFSDVTNFVETNDGYSFTYFGRSTQTYREAIFNKPSIVGCSIMRGADVNAD